MATKNKKKKKKVKAISASPIVNPELRSAIDGLKQENSMEKQNALTEALKNAKLLSPVIFDGEPVKDEKGRMTLKPTQIRFILINTKDGKTFFPAFTDIAETEKFRVTGENDPKPQNVVRTMKEFDQFLRDPNNKASGVVINPGSDNIVIPKNLVSLAAGTLKIEVRQPASQPAPGNMPNPNALLNVRYVEPSIYPTKMINAVYDHCATVPEIDRVFFKQKLAGNTVAFWLAVEADKQDPSILEGIVAAAEPLSKEIPVEAVFVNEKLMNEVIKDTVALYDRALEL